MGPQDFISFYLLDPLSEDSLIPPAAGFEFTNLYLNQTHVGLFAINADYVTVTPGSGSDPDHVSIDVTHLSPAQSARIAFQMVDFASDNRDSLLAIDNVRITIPEPAAGLFVLATCFVVGLRRR